MTEMGEEEMRKLHSKNTVRWPRGEMLKHDFR